MKARLAFLVLVLTVVAVACGPAYSGQPMDYGNPGGYQVRQALSNVHVRWVDDGQSPSNAECVLGLTAGGATVIGATISAPVSTTAWFVFSTITGATGAGFLGKNLGECLSQYEYVKPVFDVYTQCPVNKPVLMSTFDDWGQVTAFINLSTCKCSLACQFGYEDAPGIPFSLFPFTASKNYFHDGANRVNGPVTGDPPPVPDFRAMAADLGLEYAGCDGLGSYKTEDLPPSVCQ